MMMTPPPATYPGPTVWWVAVTTGADATVMLAEELSVDLPKPSVTLTQKLVVVTSGDVVSVA